MDVKKYFKKSGLIPAIVTDAENGEVLMLAYMNEESLQKTLETGYTWFWSRSRQELWNKGATSGSRVKFYHPETQAVLLLHKPHPGDEMAKAAVDSVVKFLKEHGHI